MTLLIVTIMETRKQISDIQSKIQNVEEEIKKLQAQKTELQDEIDRYTILEKIQKHGFCISFDEYDCDVDDNNGTNHSLCYIEVPIYIGCTTFDKRDFSTVDVGDLSSNQPLWFKKLLNDAYVSVSDSYFFGKPDEDEVRDGETKNVEYGDWDDAATFDVPITCFLYFIQRDHLCDIFVDDFFETIGKDGSVDVWKCSLYGDLSTTFLHKVDCYSLKNDSDLKCNQMINCIGHDENNETNGKNNTSDHIKIIHFQSKNVYSVKEFLERDYYILGKIDYRDHTIVKKKQKRK